MRFTKMQGIGNDYVYVCTLDQEVADPASLAVKVSDRHFGIGSDGLILIKPAQDADFEMEMYNADGSKAQMCGNGIRCVGKYVYDHGLTDKTKLSILTGSGIKTLDLTVKDGKVSEVKVNMGHPVFMPDLIPVKSPLSTIIGEEIEAAGRKWSMTCLSMGNPHCVVPVEDPEGLDLEKIGPAFENHELFPEKINTEFIKVLDKNNIRMRVWERGSGETMACGTGACAAACAAMMLGLCGRIVEVKLNGGTLRIEWDMVSDIVYMTGPAVTVFEGEYFMPGEE